jgi:hypothetical protein
MIVPFLCLDTNQRAVSLNQAHKSVQPKQTTALNIRQQAFIGRGWRWLIKIAAMSDFRAFFSCF